MHEFFAISISLIGARTGPIYAMGRLVAPTAEFRYAQGIRYDVAGLGLWLVGAGARFTLAPTLELDVNALALLTSGRPEVGAAAGSGGGGELRLRLSPFPLLAVRPELEVSVGLLLFPNQPFLPGGDVYDGIISFGASLHVPLGAHLALHLRTFVVHLSNGQGLGRHNPAFDGWGAGVGVSGASQSALQVIDHPQGRPPTPRHFTWAAGYSLGETDGAQIHSGQVRATGRFAAWLLGSVEVWGGSLDQHGFGQVSAAAISHNNVLAVALEGTYRRYAGANIGAATSQWEWHITPEASFLAMGQHERSYAFGTLWRAGGGLRVFPLSRLAIDVGLGWDRINAPHPAGDNQFNPYFTIEGIIWSFDEGSSSLSLFVDRQISSLNLVGLRIAGGFNGNLRSRDRVQCWRPLR